MHSTVRKIIFAIALLCTAAVACAQTPGAGVSPKKGLGLAEKSGFGIKQLQEVNAAWYYNWNSHSDLPVTSGFVPMIFSLKHIEDTVSGDYVLGFNEPDNSKQSSMIVEDALDTWATVAAKATMVGSPAVAGNPATGDWLPAFMKGAPKVDFVTVHWYKGVDATRFIADIQAVHKAYGLPVWVTEFAPQTEAGARKDPNKYTQDAVNQFISQSVQWMDNTPYVQRYAWHDSKVGTSALFNENGGLTPTGQAYAGAN